MGSDGWQERAEGGSRSSTVACDVEHQCQLACDIVNNRYK